MGYRTPTEKVLSLESHQRVSHMLLTESRKRQALFEELSRSNAPYSQAYPVTTGHAESLHRKDSLVPAFRERRKLILGNGWHIF